MDWVCVYMQKMIKTAYLKDIVLQLFELPRCREGPQTLNPHGINERFSFNWPWGVRVPN